ncbi:MAG TPA: M48 family metalloprotease [Gaiellaceae bacterium]|jgi:heat shock protein HtpX|nr:M48 family metalloprotease [Gaiellaceae bacterium]
MRGSLPAIANVLKAWALVLGVCAFLGALGFAAGGYRLLSILVFCALLLAGGAYWYSDRVALGLVGARELPVGEAPALHSTVERLAAVAGVLKPRLYLIPDGHPRALAAGRGPRASALAVSAGLVSALTPAELEGVIAHELAHVRNRDIVVQTAAVVIAAALVETSRLGGWLARALLFVLGPVAAAFVHLLLSPTREFAADTLAAGFCGSPHGLADALVRLEQANDLVHFEGSPATEPLYTINPFAEEGLAGLFASHPPISERVRRLRALDPGWRDRLRAA